MALTAIAAVVAIGATAYASYASARAAKKKAEVEKHKGVMEAHDRNVAVAGEDMESEQNALAALMRNTGKANQ